MDSDHLNSLLACAVNGDSAARCELICRVATRLENLTRLMFRNDFSRLRRWEETDDVYQQAVMRLDRSLADARPGTVADFYRLATAQIRRTLIDTARHYYGPLGPAANHDTQCTDSEFNAVAGVVATESDLSDLSQWTFLHQTIESLPDDQREAFSLVWYGGMTQDEAATLIGVSRRTFIRRLNRARLTVYREMQGDRPSTDTSSS